MKASAIAPANIAFIKYWGKKDEKLRLPLNSSISMNLSEAYTTTTVEFSPRYHADEFMLLIQNQFIKSSLELKFNELEKERISAHLDRIRDLANIKDMSKVVTINNFPKSSGIASSASGFAALTLAAAGAAGLDLPKRELSVLARLGSGSACRSIPDGLVEWKMADRSEDSYAYSLYPATHWDLRDILCVVSAKEKKVASTAGMEQASTSPRFTARLAAIPGRVQRVKQALKNKDLAALGEVIEEECLDMHAVMQTQNPPLYYWNDTTKQLIEVVRAWRKVGLSVYFTIDAGPNVHLICEGKDEEKAMQAIKATKGIQEIIVSKPTQGAHLISNHLF